MNDQCRIHGVVYSRKFRKCGRPGCKCNEGEMHGPYWYSRNGDGQIRYVGTELPDWVISHLQLLRSSKKMLVSLKKEIIKRQDAARKIYDRASQELQTLQALEAGEYCDSEILASLGLSQFNGHEKGGA